MPIPALLSLLLIALVLSPGRLSDASRQVEGWLPAYTDLELPKPRPKPSEKVAATLSILQLRDAKYRPGYPLEPWIEALDGKLVSIEGYMAIGTLEGLRRFELVPEDCECGRSKVNHFVSVTLTDDVTRFKPGRFHIVGVFSASEEEEDGFVTSVYRLRARELPE